jgi:hypothetical protein
MSRGSDPQAVTDALAAAIDAFSEEGFRGSQSQLDAHIRRHTKI